MQAWLVAARCCSAARGRAVLWRACGEALQQEAGAPWSWAIWPSPATPCSAPYPSPRSSERRWPGPQLPRRAFRPALTTSPTSPAHDLALEADAALVRPTQGSESLTPSPHPRPPQMAPHARGQARGAACVAGAQGAGGVRRGVVCAAWPLCSVLSSFPVPSLPPSYVMVCDVMWDVMGDVMCDV
jgi:hypothetical protein